MYKDIIEGIDLAITSYSNDYSMNNKNKIMMINGLKMARRIVDNIEDINVSKHSHTAFEEVVRALKDDLSLYEMQEIIEDILEEDMIEER